ncbi:MAG: flagellar hook-associated protein FlgK [Alphaproteobacteria bacterium]|nr:flagellar hook-associated protein FlgK [Alphaproteobacteria bacterium]
MSISQALSTAGSGLGATSKRASVVAGNVSNALTPGYVRREVSTVERIVGGQGAGVDISGVTRSQNAALTASRRASEADSVKDQEIATAEAQLSRALGGPDDEYAFFKSISNLENAFSALRETPESATLQRNVLEAAKELTSDFHQLSTEANNLRLRADEKIERQVKEVNDALQSIDSLNAEIRSGQASGRDVTALEDQRQRLIDRVSGIIPIREVPSGDGEVNLITQEGVFLLSGRPIELSFDRATTIGPESTLLNGDVSGLRVGDVDITPGSNAQLALRGGSLAAQFAIRDRIAPEFSSQLDALAEDLIRRFSDPAVDPSLSGGAPGLFTDGGAAIAVVPPAGVASRIAVNAAVDPDSGGALSRFRDGVGATSEGPAGSATIVDSLLAGLRERRPITGAGFSGLVSAVDAGADFSSLRATASLSAERIATTSAARTKGLIEAEQEISAVDTDFELQNLLQIEQAYQANARVIQIVDQMLSRLLEI